MSVNPENGKQGGEMDDTEAFYLFYTDLFENRRELLAYYLSDNAVLHWFGHTIKGSTDVAIFSKSNFLSCKHHFDHIMSCDYDEIHKANDSASQRFNLPSTSSLMFTEKGQGDGIHNNLKHSPSIIKRIKLECETGDNVAFNKDSVKIRYLLAEGAVEFQKPTGKKLHETKWRRPCRLHIAYYRLEGNQDYTILYMIYEGNVKCRRNLLNEFSAEESED